MLECIVEGTNIFNPIEGKLDKVIEYFVKFYGEKYRQRIEERLKSTTFLFLGRLSPYSKMTTKTDVNIYFLDKINNLYKDFLNENNLPLNLNLDVKNIDEMLDELDYFKKYGKIYETAKKNFKQIFIFKGFLGEDESASELLKDSEGLKVLEDELLNMKALWDKNYKEKLDYLREEKRKTSLVLGEIERDIEEIYLEADKQIENLFKNYFLKHRNIDITSVSKIKKDAYISALEALLSKKKITSKLRKQDCLELFNFLGFNVNNFEELNSNAEIKKLINNKELNLTYEKIRTEMLENLIEKCVYINSSFNYLNSLGLLVYPEAYKSIIKQFIINNFQTAGLTCPTTDEENTLHPLCFLNEFTKLGTETFVHECNHIIATDRVCNDRGEFLGYKTGFRFCSKQYELLDEVVNDYLALKVYDMMKADGFIVGGEKFIPSTYANAFPLLKNFIEDNLEDIKECLMSEDAFMFAKKIGVENFDMLANAVNAYFDIGDRENIALAYQELKNFDGDLDSVTDTKRLNKNARILNDAIFIVDNLSKTVKKNKNKENKNIKNLTK